MSRNLVCAVTFMAVLGLFAVGADAQNQIRNWEFDEPLDTATASGHWWMWQAENFTGLSVVEGEGLSGRYAMKVDISEGASGPLQVIQSLLRLEQGTTYVISFTAKAEAPRTIGVRLQGRTLYNWQTFWQQTDIELTTEPQTFTFEYTHTGETVGGTGIFDSDIDWYFLHGDVDIDVYYDRIWLGTEPPPSPNLAIARDPSPGDGDTNVSVGTSLRWTPGVFARTHDVYFGTSFDDVNTADRTNPLDVLVSRDQEGSTYIPESLLAYGQTYYWRVDEVNAPPDSTAVRGDVWSFTAAPYAYPITNVSVTASSSSFSKGMTPEKTIDGSGMNAADEHGTGEADMWLSGPATLLPAWIQYEFDQIHTLHEMWVWNSNQTIEFFIGFGARDVTVEYSEDGIEWSSLGDVEFARATGDVGYAHNTTVDFAGVRAQYVKLTIHSNWGGLAPQCGLSEVRFFSVPMSARDPDPTDGALDVAPQVTLSWRPGRKAASHQVYFGTDPADLALEATVSEPRYGATLDLGRIYSWQVVEVNEAATPGMWASDVWSFSTSDYVVVDDFESYTDDFEAGQAIFQSWSDGWEDPKNGGSQVGYGEAPFAEQVIVHSGKQSMPLAYDHSSGAVYSDAEYTFDMPQDWTVHGIAMLVVYFHGRTENAAAPLYVKIDGRKVLYDGGASATTLPVWKQWSIDLASSGANLKSVGTLTIGLGDGKPGGTGTIYIDDIRLYRVAPQVIAPVDPGTDGLVAHYTLNGNVRDSSGEGHHGTVGGGPVYVDGPAGYGQALEFNGVGGQYVDCGAFNPSEGTGRLTVSLWARWNGLSGLYQGLIGKRDTWAADDMMWQIEANQGDGTLGFFREGSAPADGDPVLPIGEWAHVAATFDGTTARFYCGGQMTGQGAFSFGSDTRAALVFGACEANGGNPFNGALDEIRLYNRALTEAEVRYLAGDR